MFNIYLISVPEKEKKRQQKGEIRENFSTGKYEFPDERTIADTKEDAYIEHIIMNF